MATHLQTLNKRKRLFSIHPFCHWCKKPLKMYHHFEQTKNNKLPHDFPTIDHLHSRITATKEQLKFRNNFENLVLACPSCNEGRAAIEERTHWFRVFWKSGMFPPPFRIVGHFIFAYRGFMKSVRIARDYDRLIRNEKQRKNKVRKETRYATQPEQDDC